MGQQQLLLLVIGVVLVGVAVIAGWYAADHGLRQNDADVIIGRCLTIATDAVFWKAKTDPYSGGNAQYSGLASGGMATLFLGEETDTGTFQITDATSNKLEITAVSKRYPEIGVRVTVIGDEIVNTEVDYDGGITLP